MYNIKYYFPVVNSGQLRKLKLTEEGKYSITKPVHGYQIANLIKKYLPKSSQYNLLDGSAGMGGDLYYIGKMFRKVIGVEKNPEHAKIAKNNLEVLGVNIEIHNASIVEYLEEDYKKDFPTGIDVLWIDPPWGGPEYKNQEKIDLFFDNIDVAVLISKWLSIAGLIIVKAPFNWNIDFLKKYKNKICEIKGKKGVAFLLVFIW